MAASVMCVSVCECVHRQNKHELGIALSLSDLYQSNPQLVFVLPVSVCMCQC